VPGDVGLQAWQRPNQTVPPSADRAAIDGASGGSNSCTSIHVVFQHVENDLQHSADSAAESQLPCVDDRFQSQLLASCWIREFAWCDRIRLVAHQSEGIGHPAAIAKSSISLLSRMPVLEPQRRAKAKVNREGEADGIALFIHNGEMAGVR